MTVDTAQTPEVLVYDGGAVAGSGSVIPNVRYEVHNQAITTNLADSATTMTALDAMWGLVELTGTNSYEGATTIRSGVLRAADGIGLPTNSLLSFNGGVYESSGTFGGGTNRVISNSAGHTVFWTGNGGFAARGGTLTVTLDNGGGPIDWGASGGFNGRTLILGSTTADSEVVITNDINLAGGRIIQVDDNTLVTTDFATLSGEISGASGSITKNGTGALILSGVRTYTGTTTLSAGTLILSKGNALAGSTTINNGTTLGIGHNDALGAAGSPFTWNGNSTVMPLGAAPIVPQNVSYNGNNTVIGSFDLTFTGTLTSNNNRSLTNNLDAGKTLTLGNVNLSNNASARTLTVTGTGNTKISGTISNGPAISGNLTKNGTGTLTLSGANTYTGTTTVSQGTLALVGGSQSSPITVSNGAFLAFDVASPTTSTSTYNLIAGSKIKIIGTPTLASYTLTTSSGITGITGNPNLDVLIPGYDLVVEGASLILKKPSGYVTWAALNGAGANLDEDHDGDSVPNGTEYFFGGPNGNTTGLTPLPGVVNNVGTLSVTWTKAADYVGVYGTDFVVETSATVAAPWIPAILDPASGFTVTITGNEVKFTFPDGPPYDGKNFVRLKVTGP